MILNTSFLLSNQSFIYFLKQNILQKSLIYLSFLTFPLKSKIVRYITKNKQTDQLKVLAEFNLLIEFYSNTQNHHELKKRYSKDYIQIGMICPMMTHRKNIIIMKKNIKKNSRISHKSCLLSTKLSPLLSHKKNKQVILFSTQINKKISKNSKTAKKIKYGSMSPSSIKIMSMKQTRFLEIKLN